MSDINKVKIKVTIDKLCFNFISDKQSFDDDVNPGSG